MLLILALMFVGSFVYTLRRKSFKKNKMKQVRAYEKKNS
jgi:hypothetical protein